MLEQSGAKADFKAVGNALTPPTAPTFLSSPDSFGTSATELHRARLHEFSSRDSRRANAAPYVVGSSSSSESMMDPSGFKTWSGVQQVPVKESDLIEKDSEQAAVSRETSGEVDTPRCSLPARSTHASGRGSYASAQRRERWADLASSSAFGRALSSYRRVTMAPRLRQVEVTRPAKGQKFGVGFRMEEGACKGVTISYISTDGVVARSSNLRVGDIVHAINGQVIETPQQAARLCISEKGALRIMVKCTPAKPTSSSSVSHARRSHAVRQEHSETHARNRGHTSKHALRAPDPQSAGGGASAREESSVGARAPAAAPSPCAPTRLVGGRVRTGAAEVEAETGAEPEPEAETSTAHADSDGVADDHAADETSEPVTTVDVSCSMLIKGSQVIVGTDAAVNDELELLYRQLRSNRIEPQDALQQLILLVGKLAVEQAALTVAHSETRGLAHGWLEYFDSHSRAPYFYNVRSKESTWSPPYAEAAAAAAPEPGCSPNVWLAARPSAQGSIAENGSDASLATSANSTSQAHGVTGAISALKIRKKAVEAARLESPRRSAVSVSL
uniref:WW domain-containing protein n=1 Tax=Chrysotila carterae TaxID=13221 RepID=A0A7S4BEG9_CHRCT|mmetsp:Transcript_3204/g.6771  ORF Transcript_3204/g.6771 Transcript_3204/m.6771 type:complete len:561 (-) Transcript_3204:529-2211(-)